MQNTTVILAYQTLSFIPRGSNEVEAIRETIDLINAAPADIKLLRKELAQLKASCYYFRSLSEVRRYLDPDFEGRFFSRSNKSFFGDSRYKWSTKTQTLTITHVYRSMGGGTSTRTSEYIPVVNNGKLHLRCV